VLPPRATLKTRAAFVGSSAVAASRFAWTTSATGQKSRVIPPLPLITPGILAGAVTAFAAGLGEFGAVITFASNIPGETRTLPLALYTALQTPDGDMLAARLAIISLSLGLAGLLVSEVLSRAIGRRLGRDRVR